MKIVSMASVPEPGPMEYVIEELIPAGHVTLVYGDGGQGKSYIALALASSIAAGKQFLGRDVKAGKVLYIDFELSLEEQARRAYSVARGLSLDRPPADLLYLSPEQGFKTVLEQIKESVEERDILLTIIDSYGAAISGDPESAKEVCDLFHGLRALGTVLLLDHQSKSKSGEKYKDKTAFGSAYKSNLSRNVWQLQRHDGADSEVTLSLNHKKVNFGPLRDPVGLCIRFGERFTVEETELTSEQMGEAGTAKDQVMAVFRELGEGTAVQVADQTDLVEGTVLNHITRLKRAGKLIPTGRTVGKAPIYQLADLPSSPSLPLSDDDGDANLEGFSEVAL